MRFYPLDGDGLWKGDRLAVLPAERASQLGAMLVRFAVRTAGELGGRLMVAQIQVPNVRFFERLGWQLRRRRRPDVRRHPPADDDRPRPVAAQAGERRDVEVPDRRPLGAGLAGRACASPRTRRRPRRPGRAA